MLLALVAAVPFVPASTTGRIVIAVVNAFVVVATVAAVGRTLASFIIALLFAGPALLFQYLSIATGEIEPLVLAWSFAAALHAATIIYLLRYVFQPGVMTTDKLYGAASGYLMLGVLWAYVYALVGHFYPGSFAVQGKAEALATIDALYFSFTVLTSTGLGDIVPLTRQARAVCVIGQLTGALFLAILIARLAGVYPPLPGMKRSRGPKCRRHRSQYVRCLRVGR